MIRVHAGGKWRTVEEIIREIPDANSDQDRRAFKLIQQWMDGVPQFTFQTSGSTGTPKQLTFERDQLETSARISERALRLKSGYTSLVCLDVDFVAGAMMVVRSLVTGMNIIVRPVSSNPLHGLEERIDFAAFVPLQVSTLIAEAPDALDEIKTVIIGGAKLSDNTTRALQERSSAFFATYGMTETLTHVALQKLNDPGKQNAFHLLPEFSAACDDRGCLVVEASHLGANPVVTNDIVELLSETTFRVVGRVDEVINSGGIKVHPHKVEGIATVILNAIAPETRFIVGAIPDERLGERVVLILEGSPRTDEDELKILSTLALRLSAYETPKEIRYVQRFRQTATQKIDRRAVMDSLQGK